MSEAKHTAGKLFAKYSEGAGWEIRSRRGDGSYPVCSMAWWQFDSPMMNNEISKGNANRLVAAWNACEDLSTEALEIGVVGELLAALKALVDRDLTYLSGKVMGNQITYAEVQAAREAIKKAEGK